jgi:type VI secretion system secreted protein VgrG
MLEMQDMAGMERVLLSTPHEDTYLHLGAPNSPKDQCELCTKKVVKIEAGERLKMRVGESDGAHNYKKTVEKEGDLTENICKGNYKKTIENTGTRTENICKGKYVKKVENTGKLTEKIPDPNPNYDRTVLPTGDLTEIVCTNKYDRHIDPDGNLTEKVKGTLKLQSGGSDGGEDVPAELKLQSDGKMLLKTEKGDIEINAADKKKNVIIKCNRRIEETEAEKESMNWGFKSEFNTGHVHEFTGGFKDEILLGGKFESIDAISLALALSAVIDIGFFKFDRSAIEVGESEVEVKKVTAKLNKQAAKIKCIDSIDITI